MLIESGRIQAQTKEGTFEANSGDLICFRPTESNQYGTHTPTLFYQAHVEFAGPPRHRLTPFLEGIGPLPVHVSLGESFDDMRKLFEMLCLGVTRAGVIHQLRIRAAIYEILAIVAEVSEPTREAVAHIDPWLRIQQRLDSTMQQGFKIDELACQMGLSTEHFIRQFKKHFSLSPKAYHTRARLEKAASALRGSDKSVKAVAYGLGFGDPKSFTRRFKHYFGVTPSDLRLSTPSEAAETPHANKRGFPMNVHLLPPNPSQHGFEQYMPRRKRATPAPTKENEILDKLCHPEKYV